MPSANIDGTSLLFTEVAPIERLEILSSLPPRTETERLVSWFFDHQSFPVSVPGAQFLFLYRVYNDAYNLPSHSSWANPYT
jgi:hypothetical protein